MDARGQVYLNLDGEAPKEDLDRFKQAYENYEKEVAARAEKEETVKRIFKGTGGR